jgi:hypothetical protein
MQNLRFSHQNMGIVIRDTLPLLSLDERKVVITACRAQCNPLYTPQLQARYSKQLRQEYMVQLFSTIDDLIASPSLSGLVIQLVKAAPLDRTEMQRAMDSAVAKELKVLETDRLPSTLDYGVWFERHFMDRLHPSLPPNPVMSKLVADAIENWIQSLERQTLIYPSISHKRTSADTHEEASLLFDPTYIEQLEDGLNQQHLEVWRHETGIEIQGVCEMRQKWYISGLTPRTYFASGGEAYSISKFLQGAFNDLADSVDPSNRFFKLNPTRLHLEDEEHYVYIYDLTTFTSNMHEQPYFLDRLAHHCKGRQVRVLDAWEGVVTKDLGEMLLSYNTTNTGLRYTSRVVAKWTHGQWEKGAHHTAGFLGVYGNIATCTFLHAAVMLQTCTRQDQLNVAGDDGAKVDIVDSAPTFGAIRLLGLIEESKAYFSNMDGCVCLKRPLYQIGDRVVQGMMTIWPNIELLPGEVDPRYPFIKDMSVKTRKASCVRSMLLFLRMLAEVPDADIQVHHDTIWSLILGSRVVRVMLIVLHAGIRKLGAMKPKAPNTEDVKSFENSMV